MSRTTPRWWPPKVGSKLYFAVTLRSENGRIIDGNPVLHVMSIFKDKDGKRRIVTAEWRAIKQRWNYEVFEWYDAAIGLIWRVGTRRPAEP